MATLTLARKSLTARRRADEATAVQAEKERLDREERAAKAAKDAAERKAKADRAYHRPDSIASEVHPLREETNQNRFDRTAQGIEASLRESKPDDGARNLSELNPEPGSVGQPTPSEASEASSQEGGQ